MRERLTQLAAQINARALRERVLLLLTGVVVLGALADFLVYQGLRASLQRVDEQKAEARDVIEESRDQITSLREELASDPNADVRERINRLDKRLEGVESRLAEQQRELIGPVEMVSLLRGLVEQDGSLELVSVQSRSAEVVERFTANGADSDEALTAEVYSHGVDLVFEGSFGDALAYMRDVEGLQWRLFWDRLDIEVIDYPKTRIRLRLHTLSLDEDWIGV